MPQENLRRWFESSKTVHVEQLLGCQGRIPDEFERFISGSFLSNLDSWCGRRKVRSKQIMSIPRGMKDIDVSIFHICNYYFQGATILACSKWDTLAIFTQVNSCQIRSALHFLLLRARWWFSLATKQDTLGWEKRENAQKPPVVSFLSRGWGKLLKSPNHFVWLFGSIEVLLLNLEHWLHSITACTEKCGLWSLVYQTPVISVSEQLHMLIILSSFETWIA